jgi:hypothetical protein
MLIRLRANLPEIFFGALLACAIFGMGMLFGSSSRHPPTQSPAYHQAEQQAAQHQPDGSIWGWLTHDATGFFTLLLFVAVGIQAALFVWQLKLIARGADDAKAAAEAAKASTDIAQRSLVETQRAWVKIVDFKVGSLVYDEQGARILVGVLKVPAFSWEFF